VSAPVRGDGLVHSYPVEVGETGTWAGRIVAVGITPSDSDKNQTCTLESIAFGESPVGPPELRIARFSLDCPFIRVGQKGKLVVEVKNIGGSDAESVRASVALGKQALPAKRVERLGPGLTATLQWDIESNDGAPLTAACHVTGKGLDAGRRSIKVRFHPKLPQDVVRSLDYVPEPVPADTGDYLVGAYYFPGWHTYERWAVLDDFPERRPILGYYREGDPEIVDWQINWALSHGISYFIYDWYWSAGGRHLEHGLHKAFLKSKYQDKMKFCLLWANHNPPNTSSEQDMIEVTKYWIENYFKHPSYLKVNGKNVMVIFSPHRFTEDMGEQAVKASFDKMRKLCEHAGVGGLYIVACTYPSKANTDLLIREGYDALSGYNYPSAGNKGQRQAPYAWMVDGYKEWWNRIADDSTLPYIPVCEPGWDSRPWHGPTANVRTGKTPQLWRKMLENAKGFVDDPKHKQHSDKKLVFLEAWNEFGEGDYIEPHAEFGFDYVEAVRRVFAPTSKQPTIVVPKDIGMGPYDLPIPPPLTEWDFATPESHTWSIGNMSDFGFSSGVMRATAQNSDPAFYSPYIDVAAGEFTKLVVRMRLDKGTEGQLFFARKGAMMTEEKSIHFKVTPDSEFHDYTLDLSANSRWRGSIGQLRLDPCDTQGAKVEIESIRFK